jgi:putative ABC transport system substrate-binding protein
VVLHAVDEREIDAAFATAAHKRIAALIVGANPFFYSRRGQIVALAARHAVRRSMNGPTMSGPAAS